MPRSLCLFSSYFTTSSIPAYVRAYLADLRPQFDRLLLITNEDRPLSAESLQWLATQDIDLLLVPNEGYDFGMWHRALMQTNTSTLGELALVNDSCIAFAPLKPLLSWCRAAPYAYCGLSESQQKGRHIQSYFLLVRTPAIPAVIDYFRAQGVKRGGFGEVIETYEVGLSRHLLDQGFLIGARFAARHESQAKDPSYCFALPMLEAGSPLIKRKFLSLNYSTPAYGHPLFSGALLSPHFAPVVAARHAVARIQALHSLSDHTTQQLFGDELAKPTLSRKVGVVVRAMRRAWLYPLLHVGEGLFVYRQINLEKSFGSVIKRHTQNGVCEACLPQGLQTLCNNTGWAFWVGINNFKANVFCW